MKLQANLAALALFGATALGTMALAGAAAATDLSINAASYTFASWDASGNPISNNIASAGGDGVTNENVAFWTATTTFSALAGSTLSITDLASDDRTVVELNGTPVASAGITDGRPNPGTFIFTPTGGQVTWNFATNGPQSDVITGVGGFNTLTLIVNNTNDGIYGGLTTGPTSLFFTGNLAGPTGAAAPEPASWALMILGFGSAGAALRRRRAGAQTA